MAVLERVGKPDRILSLDVLRGIAILSILMMNVYPMGAYEVAAWLLPNWTPLDSAVYDPVEIVFEGTQRGLLEMLFGAGMMIMTRAAATPEGPVAVADLHFRRNLWLVAFGIFQVLVLTWYGDILIPYGIVALVLFPFRNLRPRSKLALAVVCLLITAVPGVMRYQHGLALQHQVAAVSAKQAQRQPLSAADQAALDKWKQRATVWTPVANDPDKQKTVAADKASRAGSYFAYAAAMRGKWLEFWSSTYGRMVFLEIFGTMLIGAALYQLGIIQGRARTRTYLVLMALGYGIGLTVRFLDEKALRGNPIGPTVTGFTWDLARVLVVLGHVCLVNLALRTKLGRAVLGLFVAPGRMPLTVYLSASVICMLVIFPGFGLGWFGRYNAAGLEAIALSVMAGQLVLANLWMLAFETGPLDWLWKSLAYGQPQPFLRASKSGDAALQPAE